MASTNITYPQMINHKNGLIVAWWEGKKFHSEDFSIKQHTAAQKMLDTLRSKANGK